MRQESGTEAERLAYDTTGLPVLSTWEVTSGSGQGNKYTWGGTAWVQTHSGGAALVSDAISLSGHSQGTVSLSTTAAQSAALTGGVYDIWSDVDCYIKVAATANGVTTSTGYLLRANNTIPILVSDQEKLGGIVASGTGTLSYHRVK